MPAKNLLSANPQHRMKVSCQTLKRFSGYLQLHNLIAIIVMVVTMLPSSSLYAKRRTNIQHLPLRDPLDSYVLKQVGSSNFLMAKDVDRPVSPASLTKILTCILAIESGKLDQDVLITTESTVVEPSKAGFKPGEKIKLVDLVKAAMVNSSNDAAFAIAIHLSGSVDAFVVAMNNKAKAIGMKNSRFTNPAGFDKESYAGNISTAEDLMTLTEYAIRNPVFNTIARLDKAVFTEQVTHKGYYLKTHNKLLDRYPYAVGIKTGYTVKAGRCLIGRAVKDNKDVLLVLLNARPDRWNIAADMFDKAFDGNRPDSSGRMDAYRTASVTAKPPAPLPVAAATEAPAKHVTRVQQSSSARELSQLRLSLKKRALASSKSKPRPGKLAIASSKSRVHLKNGKLALSKSGRKNAARTALSPRNRVKGKKNLVVASNASAKRH